MGVEFADGAGAAFSEGGDAVLHARADGEEAGAEGAEQVLVAGRGEEVDAHGFDVDWEAAGGLRGVDQQGDVGLVADLSEVGDGLDGA